MLLAIVAEVLLPPTGFLVIGFAGLALRPAWRGASGGALLFALAGLTLTALPATSKLLLASLESGLRTPEAATGTVEASRNKAIVLLGGDQSRTGERDMPYDVGPLTLARERAAATLARRTGLPVLVTGSPLSSGAPPIADLMARSMEADFAVRVRWIEPQARTTWENAERSAAMLRAEGIDAAYVVTQAWHMRRALEAFRHARFAVTAAPGPLDPAPAFAFSDLVPRPSAWVDSSHAIHEWVGIAYYALRG